MPTTIRVSSLPEITVGNPPTARETAVAVKGSAVLNGVIQQPKSSHYFRFEAEAGDVILLRAESMKLGYHLDPTITLLDAAGKKLAYADDPGIDERTDEFQLDPDLSYRCEKAGTYYVAIRDGMYRGGDRLLYRLTLHHTKPDFIVELREPAKTLYQGQADTLQVRVRRRSWDQPIEVWAEGLPQGITVEKQVVAPKDSVVKDTCGVDRVVDGSIVLLPVRIAEGVPGQAFPLRIKARGVSNGVTVEHEAVVNYPKNSTGLIFGAMQLQQANLSVASPAKVILTPPDVVAIAPGKERKVKVAVRRFSDAKTQEIVIRGQGVQPVTVPADAREAQVTLKAAATQAMVLEAVSTDGRLLGQSTPFLLEVKPEPVGRN